MTKNKEDSGLVLRNTRRIIELPFQGDFHKNYSTIPRAPYPPTQLISLHPKNRFPREVFGPNHGSKSKRTSEPHVETKPVLQQSESRIVTEGFQNKSDGRNRKKVVTSSSNIKTNNMLADMKKLRIDCAQIFHQGGFLPEINIKQQPTSNSRTDSIPSSRIVNNVKNALYFNGNSTRNLYLRPVLQRREVVPKPYVEDAMRETAHFLLEKVPNGSKQGILSAPPKLTKEQRAMRELKAMQGQPVQTTEKKTFRRKYKVAKKVKDKRESAMEVTFSK